MRSWYGIIPVTSTVYSLHCSCYMLRLHACKYFNSISFSTDAETCTSCRCSNTNEKFCHTSDFPDKLGFKTIPLLFSRNRLSTSTVFGSDISLRQDSAVRALQLSILTNVYVSCLPCPRQLVAVLVLHAMENLLALALPVADAVSFEFDGINVTAQHVMARSVPLMRLLAFYDQFIKSQ